MSLPVVAARKFCVYGIQGSGKSHLAKHIVNTVFPNKTIVITPRGQGYEWKDVKCFFMHPSSVEELEMITPRLIRLANEGKLKLLLIDEADLWLRHNFDITPKFREIITSHRHMGLSLGLITRRPQDVPAVITESCYAHFWFKMDGVHALKRAQDMHENMSELMQKINYDRHDFVVKELGKDPYIHEAIK